MSLYAELAGAIRDHQPIALATVIDGPGVTGKLLVRADGSSAGSLGHPELDRVVARVPNQRPERQQLVGVGQELVCALCVPWGLGAEGRRCLPCTL